MKNPSLLPLVVVLLLAVSLLATTAVGARLIALVDDTSSPYVECEGDGGVYAANSTYEANRRRLAGLLLAEAAVGGPYFAKRAAVGYWPNRPQASFCGPLVGRRDVNGTGSADSPCAACIAGAFLELERACPYHREVSFYGRNCTLLLGEYRIFGPASMHGEFCLPCLVYKLDYLACFFNFSSFTCRKNNLRFPILLNAKGQDSRERERERESAFFLALCLDFIIYKI